MQNIVIGVRLSSKYKDLDEFDAVDAADAGAGGGFGIGVEVPININESTIWLSDSDKQHQADYKDIKGKILGRMKRNLG